MSKASAVRAGQAFVELYADNSKLESGLKRAQERLRAFGSAMRQAGTTMGLGGAAMMAPLLMAVRDYAEAAKRLELPKQAIPTARRLVESMENAKESTRQLSIAVGAALAPAVARLSDNIAGVVNSTTAWTSKNETAAKSLFLVSGAIAAVGAALVTIGIGASVWSYGVGGFAAAMKGAKWIMAEFRLVLATVTTALPALLNPIAWVTAAAAGIGYAIMRSTVSGRAYLAQLSQGFSDLSDDVSETAGGIIDALAGGEISAAAEIAWQGIKVVSLRALHAIDEFMGAFIAGVMKAFVYMGEGIAKEWALMVRDIANTLTQLPGWISEAQNAAAVTSSFLLEKAGAVDTGTTDQAMSAAAQSFTDGQERIQDQMREIERTTQERYAAITRSSAEMRSGITSELSKLLIANDQQLRDMRSDLTNLRKGVSGPGAPLDNPGVTPEEQRRRDEERYNLMHAADVARQSLISNLESRADRLKNVIANVKPPQADTFGTFSAAASFGMGIGSTAADRTAAATEKTVQELQQVRMDLSKLTGATFAP